MVIHVLLTEYLRRRAAMWKRRRTERFISSLPPEIQKDIGWPGANGPSRGLHRNPDPALEPTWQPR